MSEVVDTIKITLKNGDKEKVVILRDLKIAHQEQATKIAARAVGNDASSLVIGAEMQKQLVRMLLISVDGKNLSGADKEDMDKWFKPVEYSKLIKVVGKLAGADEGNEMPEIEMMTSGNE